MGDLFVFVDGDGNDVVIGVVDGILVVGVYYYVVLYFWVGVYYFIVGIVGVGVLLYYYLWVVGGVFYVLWCIEEGYCFFGGMVFLLVVGVDFG